MHLVKHSILLMTLVLSLVNSLFIQADAVSINTGNITEMTLAVEDSWPPYANAYGEGISTDIVSKALGSVGVKLNLKVYPYARVLNEMSKGLVAGAYNVTRQKSSEEQFIFGDQAILTASSSFYFPQKNIEAQNYTSISDIPDGASIGVITDYEYGDVYEQQKHRFKEIKVLQQTQVINMLRLDRIDGAIMFDTVASYTLQSMGLDENSINKGFLNHNSDVYVAFSKAHKNSVAFAKKLDEGLLKIKNNGQYLEIIDQWEKKVEK